MQEDPTFTEARPRPGPQPSVSFSDLALRFINELRHAGVSISVSESLDAVHAVLAVGLERETLKEALAASLIKDEDDRSLFDEAFDRFFAFRKGRQRGVRVESAGERTGQQTKARGEPSRPQQSPPNQQSPSEWARSAEKKQVPERSQPHAEEEATTPRPEPGLAPIEREKEGQQNRHAARKALLEKPLKLFDGRDVEAAKELVEELSRRLHGHLSRRYKRRKHGRLDFRRTIRASIPRGGVPVQLLLRGRRPGRPDLVALCDLSGSVAVVSDFLLALVAPAAGYFRRVRTFAYVDRLCEVSFENGHVVPHEALDLYARSDFGKVLQSLWHEGGERLLSRHAVVLILGDARNNRRPPRPDLLARLRDGVKSLVWLNPDPPGRWDTGDSVIGLYTSHCDAVLPCGNLRELLDGLKRAL